MEKKNILILLLVLVLVIAGIMVLKNKKSVPADNPQQQVEVQNTDTIQQDRYISPEAGEMENAEEQDPNALDYMAPGHRKARERVKQVQEMRQKALDDQRNDMQRLEQQ